MRSCDPLPRSGTLKARIMDALIELAPSGATDEELHRAAGYRMAFKLRRFRFASVRNARLRLVCGGLVQASSGARQLTSWGEFATKWKATPEALRLAASNGTPTPAAEREDSARGCAVDGPRSAVGSCSRDAAPHATPAGERRQGPEVCTQ